MTLADFAAVEAIATRTEGATTVSGLGDQAYSTTVGSGAFTVSSLQIIKGGKGLLISGPATLTQMEALANQILPQL